MHSGVVKPSVLNRHVSQIFRWSSIGAGSENQGPFPGLEEGVVAEMESGVVGIDFNGSCAGKKVPVAIEDFGNRGAGRGFDVFRDGFHDPAVGISQDGKRHDVGGHDGERGRSPFWWLDVNVQDAQFADAHIEQFGRHGGQLGFHFVGAFAELRDSLGDDFVDGAGIGFGGAGRGNGIVHGVLSLVEENG